MSIQDEPHIEVSAKLIASTAKAWQLERLSDQERFWIPKSVGEWVATDRWVIAKWFADKEGLE